MPVMKCPRCLTDNCYVISRSPVKGVWEMYNCKTCRYSWRSTDVLENRDPDKFPVNFRWDAGSINKFADYPPVTQKK